MGEVTPYLLYEDVAVALGWLAEAYGFTETLRFTEDDGRVSHAEMSTGGSGVVMLGQPGGDYRNPAHSGHHNGFLQVVVDDVDAHLGRARSAGATILSEPADKPYGIRTYGSLDLEGHRWDFATELHAVEPEDWGATTSQRA